MSKAVYELEVVKVKKEAIESVRECIKGGYFKEEDMERKRVALLTLMNKLCLIYGVPKPRRVYIGSRYSNSYTPSGKSIRLNNYSIISMLHELRHHMQNVGNYQYRGLTVEQDSRAFSMRVYYLAVPKLFIEAVKGNRVHHVKWDNELNKVVDNATYI